VEQLERRVDDPLPPLDLGAPELEGEPVRGGRRRLGRWLRRHCFPWRPGRPDGAA
jgi:hypothetical protein